MNWRHVSWTEYCKWLTGKTVSKEEITSDNEVQITFSNGSQAIIESNYDYGYSDYTPGDGIQAPTVKIRD